MNPDVYEIIAGPPRRIHLFGVDRGRTAKETSRDLYSVMLPARATLSPPVRPVFSILCLFVLLCRKRKRSSFQNHQRCRLFREPPLSSSLFFPAFLKCSFANMVSFALGPSASTTQARDFALKQFSQSRRGTAAFVFMIVGNASKAISTGEWVGFSRHFFCLQNIQELKKKSPVMGRAVAQHC